MSFTRIDCHFFRAKSASLDNSAYVALNPRLAPGSLVIAGASAARGNIGGQVACRLSLEHFIEGVFDHLEGRSIGLNGATNGAEREESVQILETAFKKANTSVYNFGHKLAAGGRMAASLLGLVIEKNSIAAGRVGAGSIYLVRGGEMFSFFESVPSEKPAQPGDSFVGSNSLVSVELASVPVAETDLVLIFSSNIEAALEPEILAKVSDLCFEPSFPAAEINQRLSSLVEEMSFFICARVGPQAIYLERSLAT